MEIRELDVVQLRDGRKGTVVERYEDGTALLLEICDSMGRTLEMPLVKSAEVERVLYHYH